MSGVRRLEVAEITKGGSKGPALVSAVAKMNTSTAKTSAVPAKKAKKK